MNNQFGGPNPWGDYLTALEQATPIIEAIAVTDYYVTDSLPRAKLAFPTQIRLRIFRSAWFRVWVPPGIRGHRGGPDVDAGTPLLRARGGKWRDL